MNDWYYKSWEFSGHKMWDPSNSVQELNLQPFSFHPRSVTSRPYLSCLKLWCMIKQLKQLKKSDWVCLPSCSDSKLHHQVYTNLRVLLTLISPAFSYLFHHIIPFQQGFRAETHNTVMGILPHRP